MSRPYYVLLTGSRNNAGDFLIKRRAMDLLRSVRPDREFVDLDAWKPLDDAALALVNGAAALVLTGGPSVSAAMYPAVYGLRPHLEDIRVPITALGIGWSAPDGAWSRTRRIPFGAKSRELLARLASDALPVSVRDYHTQNTLVREGISEVVMTGCPALYDLDSLGRSLQWPVPPRRITVSTGVRFARSEEFWAQTVDLVRRSREAFASAEVVVAFHHATDERFEQAYGRKTALFAAQRRFARWLQGEGVPSVDVSGSSEALVGHYSETDVHVGYRVHAHIFMTSVRKPSLLLAEDGRGAALKAVLGGHVIEAAEGVRGGIVGRALQRAGVRRGVFRVAPGLARDLIDGLVSDGRQGAPRAAQAVDSVERHWPVMERFLKRLP